MGRAAARRNAPKQPRAIRAGPHQVGGEFGLNTEGLSNFFMNPGVYLGIFMIPGDIRGYWGISGDIWEYLGIYIWGYLGISGDKPPECQGKIT